ncbi:hypothetical protein [Salinisphaera dokdonensis]
MLLNIRQLGLASWITTLVAAFLMTGFIASIMSGTGVEWAVLALATSILGTQAISYRRARAHRSSLAAAP